MKRKHLRVAVIGVGAMGQHHARNYAAFPGIHFIGVCDLNEKLGKKIAKLYHTTFYKDYRQLLATTSIDAISIVVPTKYHGSVAFDCLNKNIHVLIEKPLAETIHEAEQIAAKALEQQSILAVGHIEQFNPGVIQLQTLIKDGLLGDILSIVVKRVGLFPPRIQDVNVVTDLAVHDLDIVTTLVGRLPDSVFARGGKSLNQGREDHAEVFLDYGSFGCFIQVNWVTPIKIRTLAITGTKGYAELNYVTQKLELYRTNYRIRRPKGFEDFVVHFGEPKKMEITVKEAEPLKLEIEHFLDAVRKKKRPKVSSYEGIQAVMLSQKVLESIVTGRKVPIT